MPPVNNERPTQTTQSLPGAPAGEDHTAPTQYEQQQQLLASLPETRLNQPKEDETQLKQLSVQEMKKEQDNLFAALENLTHG